MQPRSAIDLASSYLSPVDLRHFDSIYFALLLELQGPVYTPGTAGAAALAVETVNADNSLLAGRVLEYSWADAECRAQQGLKAMGAMLRAESRISAVVGPGCSSVCEVTSQLSGGQNLAQISWGCTSPTLSDKSKFQLVRTGLATIALFTGLRGIVAI